MVNADQIPILVENVFMILMFKIDYVIIKNKSQLNQSQFFNILIDTHKNEMKEVSQFIFNIQKS